MESTPPGPETLAQSLDAARLKVEAALDGWLPKADAGAPRLAEAMRYSVFAGGKRLRPALAFAAASAVGGDPDAALPLACALELIHTYSLIHDDLPAMDDDDLRRGRPTSHKVYGEAHAILTGDALHTLAFALLLQKTSPPELAQVLGLELATAAGFDGMVGGQVEDLAGDGQAPDAASVYQIHLQKTAALIRAAASGGGRAGGATEEQVEALCEYGQHLGLAFQIVDDILDETGTAEALGKTPGKDRQVEKQTCVALDGLEAARTRAREETARAVAAAERLPLPQRLIELARFVLDRDR